MPIHLKIDDVDVSGFSDPAKARLREAGENYILALIQEANRIEAGRNTGRGVPEVTQGMVSDAVIVQRQGLGSSPRTFWSKMVRVLAAVFSLIAGLMFDAQLMQSKLYVGVFLFVVAVAIITVTVSILKE